MADDRRAWARLLAGIAAFLAAAWFAPQLMWTVVGWVLLIVGCAFVALLLVGSIAEALHDYGWRHRR